jgi:Protein of unknown function (DUF2911)
MKKTITILASLALLLMTNISVAQRGPAGSPRATVKQQIGNTNMEIDYGRPSLAGRDAYEMVTTLNNGVWRTGANTNTKISFDKDVTIGGTVLKAGEYSLWTIPGKNEWTIIISGHLDKWGTAYDDSKDVIKFSAKATTSSASVETFTINLSDFNNKSKDRGNLELAWGNISVKIPIVVKN